MAGLKIKKNKSEGLMLGSGTDGKWNKDVSVRVKTVLFGSND